MNDFWEIFDEFHVDLLLLIECLGWSVWADPKNVETHEISFEFLDSVHGGVEEALNRDMNLILIVAN